MKVKVTRMNKGRRDEGKAEQIRKFGMCRKGGLVGKERWDEIEEGWTEKIK
jgi:hypothetical protein